MKTCLYPPGVRLVCWYTPPTPSCRPLELPEDLGVRIWRPEWSRGAVFNCIKSNSPHFCFGSLKSFALPRDGALSKKTFFLKFYSLHCEQWLYVESDNTAQWITWLGGRWRTQQTARRNVNCRTYEHRHFERILRALACPLPMSGSGSVYHPSKLIFELGIGPSLLTECGLKVKCALMRLPVLTLWSNLLGLSLTIHLVTTLATGRSFFLLVATKL